MAKLVSLTTASVVINNPNYEQIIIGGNGQLVGSISMKRNNPSFSVEGSIDGGYVASYKKDHSGSLEVEISQSSSLIGRLRKFINWCEANPNLAESTITVLDTLGNMQGYAEGVFPDKIPDNSLGDSAGQRTYTFNCGKIEFEEGNE